MSKIYHTHFTNQINFIHRYSNDDNRRNDDIGRGVANVTKNNDNVMHLIPTFSPYRAIAPDDIFPNSFRNMKI